MTSLTWVISKFLNLTIPTTSITPTIHFAICHGPAVLRYLGNRTGHLSEEAQERTNKIIRSSRLNHTSKISPFSVMEDLSHWLFQSCDRLLYWSFSHLSKKALLRVKFVVFCFYIFCWIYSCVNFESILKVFWKL